MDPQTVLVTGGAGFVGSHLALHVKAERPARRVIALDNLRRRGAELNLPRLRAGGVEFVHGDVRVPGDLEQAIGADLLLECSAEPSVLAGYESAPDYVLQTNLVGTLNVLEYCRRHATSLVFLSTSRVYPIGPLRALALREERTRFELDAEQGIAGASAEGIAETFPLHGARSLYGVTKLASELCIEEYRHAYGLRAVVDRCGVLAGPWQMGRVDQGFLVLWVARHVYGGELAYLGFEGSGKQVRDVLHVDDLCRLVSVQVARLEVLDGGVFNVGGGRAGSVSLLELTELCRRVSGRTVATRRVPEGRRADVPVYLSDTRLVRTATGWAPRSDVEGLVADVYDWIVAHRAALAGVLGG